MHCLCMRARASVRNLSELGIRDEPALVPVEDTKEVVRDLRACRSLGPTLKLKSNPPLLTVSVERRISKILIL